MKVSEELTDKLVFYGKRWLNRMSIALAILLMIPTTAIMATWNTLPGQKLYPVKRYLEEVALKLVGDNFMVKADLQAQFVEKRFNETEILLTQSSSAGLAGLTAEIQAAKTEIVAAKARAGTRDAAAAPTKAEKLVVQLTEYNQKLEAAKAEIVASEAGPTPIPSVQEVADVRPSAEVEPTLTPPSNAAQVAAAQEEIEQVIEVLSEVAEDEGDHKEEKKDKDDNKDKEKEQKSNGKKDD